MKTKDLKELLKLPNPFKIGSLDFCHSEPGKADPLRKGLTNNSPPTDTQQLVLQPHS